MKSPTLPRTPKGDGFVILPEHRGLSGNIQWGLIWRDFAKFVGIAQCDILSRDPMWIRDELSEAARQCGYDHRCVGALCLMLAETPEEAHNYAAALGFDPIYLWPTRAARWPEHLQRLAAPVSTRPATLKQRLRNAVETARNAILAGIRG
ncbi:hypothetical protein [Blastomonas sp.]|jgi:hypothetical protein|uniref:hypothetical protein n=1 Tax=Blastomonas sp. TaxID=1909299 RepID=UPI00406A7226